MGEDKEHEKEGGKKHTCISSTQHLFMLLLWRGIQSSPTVRLQNPTCSPLQINKLCRVWYAVFAIIKQTRLWGQVMM